MMNITEKVAYLKGLMEGLKLDEKDDTVKVIKAVIDVLDDMAITVADLDDEVELIGAQLDEVDDDLASLEDDFYGDYDEDEDYGEEMFEVVCPACGETVYFEDSALDDEYVVCPACGEKLEFDFELEDGEESEE
jgi:DNA-directed RNA polymerase subunit RPC12/RpoP